MNLSKRLNTVASFVTPGRILADIGTDHGYIPILLVSKNIIPQALAMDVNEGPLQRASANIIEAGLQDRIIVRLSDGLKELKPGEAEAILIAGMGGMLIKRILQNGMELVRSAKELVLSPHREEDEIRRFLHKEGFLIAREEMIKEDGKFYVIIKALSGEEEYEKEIFYKFGYLLLKQKNPVLQEYLIAQKKKAEKIIYDIRESGSNKNPEKIKELEEEIVYLEEALNYYS
ncbi:tRNA (adenine(22)-N(1))-methyltransferase [Parasporobacterium paucivorans]|uniref:tRNA (Adenine22-N1)-methyltransferase n=1 Tax=Parasporobacterium paucivorans DSM 15970 TaxID=1122934 RepID=A0A1M6AKZ5_9FIRM|nr:class I SAM-dependent methyltransferase [Parasporobacterium paucivorans]SHI37125.1 tRNA (adenine22-N1)-methyltransferase [Parasporobacterium paucivorans DSM 15970]